MSPRQPSIVVHLRGQHSGGQLAVVEVLVAAGAAGPPLHVHPAHAEGVYLLEGELLVQVRDASGRFRVTQVAVRQRGGWTIPCGRVPTARRPAWRRPTDLATLACA